MFTISKFSMLCIALLGFSFTASTQAEVTTAQKPTKIDLSTLQTQADKGDAKAQYMLFQSYWGKDNDQALKYLNLAAAQDYPLALNGLGWVYYKGDGVPQDYQKAVLY